VVCCDAVGYAAVGAGERHADTYLMQSNFTRHFSNTKTLFLCYAAKRRSEIAPGVGKKTDIRIAAPAGGFFYVDSSGEYRDLDSIYDKMIDLEKRAEGDAIDETRNYATGKIPIARSSND